MNPFPDDPIGYPISRHLDARARTIDLPRTDVGVIVDRADRRRRHRRQATYGLAGVTLLAGTTFAFVVNGGDGDEDRTPVATSANAVVESPLDWTVVQPAVGLASATEAFTSTPDGAVYRLSTAPGPADWNAPGQLSHRTLYRSDDGSEWQPLALPDGFYASALASSEARLFAVGTAPVGGDLGPVGFSTSDDGGATWTDPASFSPDLVALQDAFGDEVVVGNPKVATHDGVTLVSVTVGVHLDIEARAPGIDTSDGWDTDADGVRIFGPMPPCDGQEVRCVEPPVIARLTWDQLEVPAELRALRPTQLRTFISNGDGTFEEVAAPAPTTLGEPRLAAGDAGFVLTSADPLDETQEAARMLPPTRFFTSPDGRTWTELPGTPNVGVDGLGVDGLGVDGLGVAGGEVVASAYDVTRNRSVLLTIRPEGIETIDVDALTGDQGLVHSPGYTGFGPMGWATVLVDGGADGANAKVLVHSDPNTGSVSIVPIPEDLVEGSYLTGVTVTADAIAVSFSAQTDGNPATVEPQRIFVGTPRG